MIGIELDDVSPYHFFEATHPEDINRHNLGRSKLFGLAQGLFITEKLFLSKHAVNTHRTNILEKSEKPNIWEVIYELKEQGYLQ